jgi:hypothetical protein
MSVTLNNLQLHVSKQPANSILRRKYKTFAYNITERCVLATTAAVEKQ